MSDIFEIKGIDAEIKIGGVAYKFCDPRFKDKVILQRRLRDLKAKENDMDPVDYLLESNEISKKMILQYLPTLPEEKLESLGDAVTIKLLGHLLELSQAKFASVLMPEPEGKSEASV